MEILSIKNNNEEINKIGSEVWLTIEIEYSWYEGI